jgi:hypothetical protein
MASFCLDENWWCLWLFITPIKINFEDFLLRFLQASLILFDLNLHFCFMDVSSSFFFCQTKFINGYVSMMFMELMFFSLVLFYILVY